jgi:hypothetical protein
MKSAAHRQFAAVLKHLDLRYEKSQILPALQELPVQFSTRQTGPLASVGSSQGQMRIGQPSLDQAIGLFRTASAIAVGTRDAIWSLLANREIVAHIKPECEHDIAFLACCCRHSGPLVGHALAWGCERLLVSLSHKPRTEVLLESGPRNPRCWLEAGLWTVGVIRALARIRSSLDKVRSWLPPPPATTG